LPESSSTFIPCHHEAAAILLLLGASADLARVTSIHTTKNVLEICKDPGSHRFEISNCPSCCRFNASTDTADSRYVTTMSIVSTIETDTTLIIRVSLVSKISTTNAATPGCVSVYFAMYNFMRRSETSEDQDKWTKTLSDVDPKDIPPIFTVETSLPWFQLGPIQPLLLQQPILVPSLVWRQ
jgi:hypothetical protein